MKASSKDHTSILSFPQDAMNEAVNRAGPGKVVAYSHYGPPWDDGKIPVVVYRAKRDASGVDVENARRYEVRASRLSILKTVYNRVMRARGYQ